jgi:dipeptidyl aminopeptidase/acylaminoacyl peptidase
MYVDRPTPAWDPAAEPRARGRGRWAVCLARSATGALAALVLGASGAPAAAPTALDLTKAPLITDVSVSPDGQHLVALTSPDGEVTDITVWSTANLSGQPVHVRAKFMRFVDVRFLKNDRLLVEAVQPIAADENGNPANVTKEYVTDLEGKSFAPLLPEQTAMLAQAGNHDVELSNARLISSLPNDPRHVLVEDDREGGDGGVYRVDVYDLSAGKIMQGSEKFGQYQADLKGELRARLTADYDKGEMYLGQQFRDPDTGEWVELFRSYARDRKLTRIVGFTTDPHVVLISTPGDGDKTGIYAFDTRQRKIVEQEFGHKLFDAGSTLFPARVIQSTDPADLGAVLGIGVLDYGYDIYWTDPSMVAIARGANQALGEQVAQTDWVDPGTGFAAKIDVPVGGSAVIESWSADRHVLIVEKSGPKQPPEYYLLAGGKLALLGKAQPWIDPAALGDTKLVEYAARDGLMIPAYLTLPPASAGPGPYPTLIEPHGGPWARDFLDWDIVGWVQYFASHGFAVLQPQFRGSEGWGQKLWRAGDAEWGQKMQDDLDDGVKWLVAQHVADAKRVAMFGYSYGGYAALAASIRPNGLYQCAISGAGAGDLDAIAEATFDNRFQREFQHPTIKGLDALAHAKEAQIPVLLYHGDHDTTVDPEQSRKFAAAAKAAGKAVKLVEIKDMGHEYTFMTPDMLKEQLDLVDSFLKTDCKPGGM